MWSALLILAVGDIVGTNLVNILFILVSASSTVAAPPTAAPDRRCRCWPWWPGSPSSSWELSCS